MKEIERTEFLDKLKAYKDKQIIKVITGIRRCGKSTLMKMFKDYLLSTGVRENQIIFLNFEDFDNADLLDPKVLHSYVK
ncbi:MAG: AAA family ATPase, partial [bacterium]|nr:AAA family ATPase [bacterium]